MPNLISINHNNFPSQFSTVYVVNHSWTHSGLWACIKRVLPQSALEKIVFLKGEQELADVFDLERLPKGECGCSGLSGLGTCVRLLLTTCTLSSVRREEQSGFGKGRLVAV